MSTDEQYSYSGVDYDDNEPLLERPSLSYSRPQRPSRPSGRSDLTGLPHPNPDLLTPKIQQRILWGRTCLIGFGWFVVTWISSAFSMLANLWGAVGACVGCLLIAYVMPSLTMRLYDEVRAPGNNEWVKTLRWAVVGGTVCAIVSGAGSAFYYREIYRIDSGNHYGVVDPTKPSQAQPIGRIDQWKDGGTVARQYTGRSVSFGIWPICVAPVLDRDAITTTVNYWAVQSHRCCAQIPPTCDAWKPREDPSAVMGGVGVYYRELLPSLEAAVADALQNSANMGIRASSAAYVYYGQPDTMRKNSSWKTITILVIPACIGLLYIFAKARWGIYEKIQ